jgi:hypothetical protein
MIAVSSCDFIKVLLRKLTSKERVDAKKEEFG